MAFLFLIKKAFLSFFFRVWFLFRNSPLEFFFRIFTKKTQQKEILLPDFFLDQLTEEIKNIFPSRLSPNFLGNNTHEKKSIAGNNKTASRRIFFTSDDFSQQSIAEKIYEIMLLLIFSGKNITALTSVRGIFTSGALTNKVSENIKTVGGFVLADKKNIEQKMAQAISHMVKSSAKSSTWVMRKDFANQLFRDGKIPTSYLGQPVICREEENFLSKEFPVVLIDFQKGYAVNIKNGAVKKGKNGFEFWIEIYGDIKNSSAMKSIKIKRSHFGTDF